MGVPREEVIILGGQGTRAPLRQAYCVLRRARTARRWRWVVGIIAHSFFNFLLLTTASHCHLPACHAGAHTHSHITAISHTAYSLQTTDHGRGGGAAQRENAPPPGAPTNPKRELLLLSTHTHTHTLPPSHVCSLYRTKYYTKLVRYNNEDPARKQANALILSSPLEYQVLYFSILW